MPPFAGEPSSWEHHTTFVSDGVKLHYVDVPPSGGKDKGNGHTLVLIHGYPETWYSWRHVIQPFADLGYRVIVPDYRGAGDSNKPNGGYDKMTMAQDIHTLYTEKLGIEKAVVVGYDVGFQVAVPLLLQFPEAVEAAVVFEAPIPGTKAFDVATQDPDSAFHRLFHFFFHNAPDNLAEKLTEGKEREYLSHFYDRLSYDPTFLTQADVDVYARHFSKAGGMRAGFEVYRAYLQDKDDLREWLKTKGKVSSSLPVLATAGEASGFKEMMEDQCKEFAENVEFEAIPRANHWIPEEQPEAFVQLVKRFLEKHGLA
ncbi:hypothetical protein JCM11251_004423 [Rhodosporidiobolus azoricus]